MDVNFLKKASNLKVKGRNTAVVFTLCLLHNVHSLMWTFYLNLR